MFYAPGEGLQGYCDREMGIVDDEFHVIDEDSEVEKDDVSSKEVTDEEDLVDGEQHGILAVRTGMSTVSHAAVHKELLWCHCEMLLMKDDDDDDEDNVESSMAEEEMIGEEEMGIVDDELHVVDEESEVEEDDVSHEEVTDEEDLVDGEQHGVLGVRAGMSTVTHAAVHKELLWCHREIFLMKDDWEQWGQ